MLDRACQTRRSRRRSSKQWTILKLKPSRAGSQSAQKPKNEISPTLSSWRHRNDEDWYLDRYNLVGSGRFTDLRTDQSIGALTRADRWNSCQRCGRTDTRSHALHAHLLPEWIDQLLWQRTDRREWRVPDLANALREHRSVRGGSTPGILARRRNGEDADGD